MDAFKKSLVALQRLEIVGLVAFPRIFGGVTRSPVIGALQIYLTEQSPDARRAFRTVFGGPIQYFTTPRTQLERAKLHAAVSAQTDHLREQGIELVSWGPDIRTGVERIGVLNLNDEKTDALVALFGPWVELHNETHYPMAAVAAVASVDGR